MTKYNNEAVKKKLLVVTTTFPRWENDTDPPFVFELTKRLTDTFDVFIHTPIYTGSRKHENIAGMEIRRFSYFWSKYEKFAGGTAILPFLKANKKYYLVLPFFLMAQFISLFLLVKKIKPDVIHAHWVIPTGLFAVLCRGNCPVVITGHGADIFGLNGKFFSWLKKTTLQRCQRITVVSNALRDKIKPLLTSRCKVTVLPMGVDEQLFSKSKLSVELKSQLNKKGPILLYVGRLTEKKGVRFLLEAFSILIKQQNQIILVIIGDGEERQSLLDLACALEIEHKVIFVGALANNELPTYYASSDIFIGPSTVSTGGDTEGFGLTFIEASFSGCFLIGSRVGGIPDIIEDGVNGLLTEPGNSNDLKNKILWAIRNGQVIVSMKDSGRKDHIKKYSWAVISDRYTEIYDKIYENNRKIG